MENQNGVPNVNPSDFAETPQYQQDAAYGSNDDSGPSFGEQPQAPAENNPVLDTMRARGYDVSTYNNDAEFIGETEARYAAAVQAEQSLQSHQSQEEQMHKLQAMQAQKESQESKGGDEPKDESGQPEFDQSWADLVEQDESGRFVVRPEYIGSVDPNIADKVNKYVNWRQDRSNKLIDDPVNTIMEAGLSEQINQAVNQAVQGTMSQQQVRSGAADFIQKNASVLYVTDEKGNFTPGTDGQPMLSPVGEALNAAHVQLRQAGMTNPSQRHQVAVQMVQNHFTQQQLSGMQQQGGQMPQQNQNDQYKDQYAQQPFAQPSNPLPPGQMPNTPVQPTANAIGTDGLPEHTSLGSLATALAVHKGYLQPKGQRGDLIWLNLQQY